jgi:serine phosphatase RsbU (regulator of sigma subunit)/PAS domain-containing protein/anti-sigma regulatory factor (Ser/Thr protein kinase)
VPPALPADVVAMFAGGGECGAELAELDWARSTLGHPLTWSRTLRTAVDIVLSSRHPLIIWWGPEHVMLYNDALAPAFADNHPWALGRAGEQVLPEMWSVIGPMLDHVLTAGEATWRDDQPLPMKRRGFVEDTYWTYSYSPIRDETGTVAGVFTATSETTDRVLRERRLRVLNDIARALDRTRTLDEACTTAVEVVCEGAPEDVPAAAVYLRDTERSSLRRVAASGDVAFPAEPEVDESWATVVTAVLSTASTQSADLLVAHADGPVVKRRIALVPLLVPGRSASVGVLAASTGARAVFDDDYAAFYASLAGSLSAALATLEALEAERRRLEQRSALDRTEQERERDQLLLAELELQRALLDQAQRLAKVGSFEIDLATGALTGSPVFLQQMEMTEPVGLEDPVASLKARVHPDDIAHVDAALAAAATHGTPFEYDVRIISTDGVTRTFRSIGGLERNLDGTPRRLVGSNQDVTEQREAEQAFAAAAAASEAAAREHRIAVDLQRALRPSTLAAPDYLTLAVAYRSGTAGTVVGGDWYDVIDLGAGRAALVIGDVMGRGVHAAAVMGQVRAAIRAYARLDLDPSHVLELLDAVVADLGPHIVSCAYALYDPGDNSLIAASAGHPSPLVVGADEVLVVCPDCGPPLGAGMRKPAPTYRHVLPAGGLLAMFSDGLIERRDVDIDDGIHDLCRVLERRGEVATQQLAEAVVDALVGDDADDDVALLLVDLPDANVTGASDASTIDVEPDLSAVRGARAGAVEVLNRWQVDPELIDDITLVISELVTNAVVYGRPPVGLSLRHSGRTVTTECHDGGTYMPRRLHATADDEHGRGLELVGLLATTWGTRRLERGKAVWCTFTTPA